MGPHLERIPSWIPFYVNARLPIDIHGHHPAPIGEWPLYWFSSYIDIKMAPSKGMTHQKEIGFYFFSSGKSWLTVPRTLAILWLCESWFMILLWRVSLIWVLLFWSMMLLDFDPGLRCLNQWWCKHGEVLACCRLEGGMLKRGMTGAVGESVFRVASLPHF